MNISKAAPGAKQICSLHKHWRPKGIFHGENPLTFATPVLLLQLSLCALLNGSLQYLLTPLGESAFISQILAGVILGPSLLGANHVFRELVFPLHSYYVCDTFANFGLMLFLFLVGVKMDLSLIGKCGRRAVIIGLCSFLMPLLLNFVLGEIVMHSLPLDPKLYRSLLWVVSFQSLTSFHVIVCLLADLKLMNSELGKLALSSSMISGTCSWFWTMFVLTGKQSVGGKTSATLFMMFLSLAGFTIFIALVLKPVFLWMARTTVNEKSVREGYIALIFVMVLVCSLFGEVVGQHFLFGPMILGMAMPDGPPLGSALIRKLDCFISTIFLPIYFVVGVARIDFTIIEPRNFGIIELLAFFAFVWKVIGAMLPSLCCKMPATDALCLGLILSTQGITDVLLLQRAVQLHLIDLQSYSIMILSIVLFAVITSPIVKFLYKPFKRYTPYKKRTIQNAKPNSELRILACIYHQEHTPSIVNLLDASYPHPQSPICLYAVHLIELAGRAAPRLVAHYPGRKIDSSDSHESASIIKALRLYERQNQGNVTVFPYTAISPNATMHEDVCTLALDKRASMVIVPFHKLWTINASTEEANAIGAVNQKILKRAPCSVGILIDRGTLSGHTLKHPNTNLYSIGVIFLGGKDDREALAYASRMAKHPSVSLTVVRFLEPKANKFSSDMELDFDMLNDLKEANLKNDRFVYQEELVKDSVGLVSVIRNVENHFDLILVGRHHDNNSPLLQGLNEWNEFPEVGFLGDMLASSDSTGKVSVLVVQQHSFAGGDMLSSPRSTADHSSTIVDMPWDTVKVCPVG